jgi:hypothetical protein
LIFFNSANGGHSRTFTPALITLGVLRLVCFLDLSLGIAERTETAWAVSVRMALQKYPRMLLATYAGAEEDLLEEAEVTQGNTLI